MCCILVLQNITEIQTIRDQSQRSSKNFFIWIIDASLYFHTLHIINWIHVLIFINIVFQLIYN